MTEPDPQLADLAQQLEAASESAAPALREQMFARYLELARGGVTTGGLPYPDPDDPWFEGADAIRALAEALGGRALTNIAVLPASAPQSSYPVGLSLMQLSGAAATSGGWPRGTTGQVFTIRGGDAVGRTFQYYMQNTSANVAPFLFVRSGSGDSGVWSAWGNAAGAYGFAAGIARFGAVAAGAGVSTTVTLPAGRFTEAPILNISPVIGTPQARNASTSPGSATSFVAYFGNSGTSSVPSGSEAYWTATQMSSAAAAGRSPRSVPADEPDAVVTCPTDGCENQGIPIPVPTHWTDDEGTHAVDAVECGVCGTVLTPTTPEES